MWWWVVVGVAVAIGAIIFRAATTADGFSHRLIQFFFLRFGSLEDYTKGPATDLSLTALVADQDLAPAARMLARIIPSQAAWLGRRFPTDKGGWHDYLPAYDSIFASYRDQPALKVLEIGVKKGGSIALWREYFAADAFIYGIDVLPIVPTFRRDAHIKILVLDSRDRAALDTAFADLQFDIIVDDGLHDPDSQMQTFECLRHRLKPEGVYLIEDVYDLRTAQYEALGYRCAVLPDPSGQYLQAVLPPRSRVLQLDWEALGAAPEAPQAASA